MERSFLMVRYRRRQLVDYLNIVITGCARGEGCDEITAAHHAVMAAIRYHAASRNSNGKVCLMGKYHNVLYIAAKLCYDWKLSDASIITQLLNAMYQCEHTFERLLVGAIFGTRVTYLMSGWKSDFENSEENLMAVEYFLKHATKAKLEYHDLICHKKTRFIDIPMESYGRVQPVQVAAQFAKPEVLLLLLRYGASIVTDCENDEVPVKTSLTRINGFCNLNFPFNQTEGPIICLKILLRAVPTMATLPCEHFDGNVCVIIGSKNEFGVTRLYFHPKLLQEGLIPPSRSELTPPELKHLSRCAIRRVLRENWQLPEGIRSLKIPPSLQNYLDLLED
jgi:ankyrin repeat/SOCS box protein 17